jgi:hypothetical protein
MRKGDRKSPTERPVGLDHDEGPYHRFGRHPLLVQAFRSLALPASVARNVSIKQRDRGFDDEHRVITALQRLGLPPKLLSAPPKRLWFLIFKCWQGS